MRRSTRPLVRNGWTRTRGDRSSHLHVSIPARCSFASADLRDVRPAAQRSHGRILGRPTIWRYVHAGRDRRGRQLFDGVDSCLAGARTAASHEWQVAWALYTGSLEGTDGTTDGKSMYALGDKRCPQFLTCEGGASSTHPARNNVAAAAEWLRGLAALGAGDCFGALAAADTVVAQATIPLLQGLLREAWEVDPAGVTIAGRPNLWKAERRPAACCAHLPTSAVCFTPHSPPARSNRSNRAHAWQGGGVADGRVEVAEGWAFTAAVLPQLALCNGSAAQLVYDNMFLNADPIVKDGFGLVKTTVEVRM